MTEFTLQRAVDVSGISGVGEVAWGVEWPDGAVAVRWHGDHPSTAAWGDIRDVEAIHGHGGKTLVTYNDTEALLSWYERLCKFVLSEARRPVTCGPHPDRPGKIRLTFGDDLQAWSFWVALLEGSTYTSVREEVNGLTEIRWTSPDGLVWLVAYQVPGAHLIASEAFVVPLDDPDEDRLEAFDREDR